MTEQTVDLKEYLLALIGEQEKRMVLLASERQAQVALALESAQRATEKAEAEALRAREAANEWRGAMNDRERSYAKVDALDALKERQGVTESMVSKLIGGLVVIALLTPIVAALAAKFIS